MSVCLSVCLLCLFNLLCSLPMNSQQPLNYWIYCHGTLYEDHITSESLRFKWSKHSLPLTECGGSVYLHRSPPLHAFLCQLNPVLILTPYSFYPEIKVMPWNRQKSGLFIKYQHCHSFWPFDVICKHDFYDYR